MYQVTYLVYQRIQSICSTIRNSCCQMTHRLHGRDCVVINGKCVMLYGLLSSTAVVYCIPLVNVHSFNCGCYLNLLLQKLQTTLVIN
jgi:hypothetical protein